MLPAVVGLWCVAALLAISVLAIAVGRWSLGTPVVYTLSLAASLVALGNAFSHLVTADVAILTLPIGLPDVGARVRLDALAAFFLVVVNLGGAAASLYALGYGRHEPSPLRVLPFFPLYLAGMILVVLADDAFLFLVAWEFMSLASWGLVMANDRSADNTRAAYIYLVMAAFGTLALLLAFGLLAGPDGNYSFDAMRRMPHDVTLAALALLLVLIGAGSRAGL